MGSQTTTARFLRSTGASIFSQAWRVVITFGTMLVLKRLIPAADWGLWNWSMPLFLILGAARDLGLVFHVVRIRPRPYGNLLWLEVVWGGVLVAVAFLGAPLLARAYADPHPDVIPLLRALTLFLFFEGLAVVPRVYFESELAIGRAVAPELLRNFATTAVSIGLAVAGCGVWSLVAGQVVSAALYAVLLWARAWKTMPLLWQRGETWRLIRASLPLALIWWLVILIRHVDPLLLGWHYRGEIVGNYVFAYENAFRVSEIIMPAVTRALYPALAAFVAEGRRLFEVFSLATVFILALEVPTALFLFVNAELVVRLLGGAQWVQAPDYLRILCLAPLVDPIGRLGGEVLKVRNRDGLWILACCVTLATLVLGGLFLIARLGPMGMAWINLLPLGSLLMAWALYQEEPAGFVELLRRLVFVYAVPVLCFAPVLLLVAAERPVERMAWSVASLVASLAVIGYRFGPDFLAFFRAATRSGGAEPPQPGPAQ